MKPKNDKILRSQKASATKREYARVYDQMCLPPRDIIVTHEGVTYIRRAWQGQKCFGWGKWEKV